MVLKKQADKPFKQYVAKLEDEALWLLANPL